MLPTGVALLVVVMTALVLAITVWAILIPGLGLITRQWRQGRWITVLDIACMLMVGEFLGILIDADVFNSASVTLYIIGAVLFGAATIINTITLGARWLTVRTRKHRTFMIFNTGATAVFLVGGGLFFSQHITLVAAHLAR